MRKSYVVHLHCRSCSVPPVLLLPLYSGADLIKRSAQVPRC